MSHASEFQLNLIKFIESHGNAVSVEGDAVVIETRCVTKHGAVYIERESVRTYTEARKVLGY